MRKARILLYDIETAGVNALYADLGFVICIGYKWLGDKDAKALVLTADELRRFDDRRILTQFSALIEEADLIVGHYADRFDSRFIRGRLIIHGLPSIPRVKSRDTCFIARRLGKFQRHNLGHLARIFNLAQKKGESGFPEKWMQVMRGNRKVLSEIVEYCKQDVQTLEALYLRLRAYDSANPDLYLNDGCKVCQSYNLQFRGWRLNKTRRYRRYQCQDCGAWGTLREGERR